MTLFSRLNQEVWTIGNYTENTGQGLSGTVFTESKEVNAKDLSGYTLKIRLYDQNQREVFSDDVDILVAANGTWEYLPDAGNLNFHFIGELEVELTKSGEELTAKGINGSSKLRIK